MTLTQINKAGLDEIALDHVFTIGASGTNHYTFQGEGLNGTVNDPTLYLTRGKTYRFENTTGAHAIRIQSVDDGTSGTLYNTGVTNNNTTGTVIVEVQHDAPDVLYYQCASHANMKGTIYVTGALADGGVTTAKLANDAVTAAKIAANAVTHEQIDSNTIRTGNIEGGAVTTERLAADAVTTAKIADNAVTSAKIADDAVTSAKIADGTIVAANIANDTITAVQLANNSANVNVIVNGAVTTDKIGDQAVTLAKLPHGTSSTNGKFLRANNGADPTFEDVPAGGISDVVSDTSPQLGGTLDCNGQDVQFKSGGGNVKVLFDASDDSFEFSDGSKAVFGASNDLQIYHDGSNSYIKHTGDGNLRIETTGDANEDIYLDSYDDIYLQVADGADSIKCIGGGATELYYNGTKKFHTTSTGAAVTNTSSPLTSANSNANDLVVSGDGASGMTIHSTGTSSDTSIYFSDADHVSIGAISYKHSNNQMRFQVNGGLGIQLNPDKTVYFQNTIYASGFSTSSDLTHKSNLVPFTNTLDKLKGVNGYTFDMKVGEAKDVTISSAGIIAQDVEKVFPKLVEGEEGGKTVQYNGLIGVLVEAVKELTTKVETLESKVAALEAK